MEEEGRRKRTRRPNFTEAELLAMGISALEKRTNLYGKNVYDGTRIAFERKAAAWQYVTDAVNAVSRVQRDVNEVKQKFKHFKSEVKKKAGGLEYHRGTGGDPSRDFDYTPAEKEVLKLLSCSAVADIPGVPCPGEEALTEGVAGAATSAGQPLIKQLSHVQFEELAESPDSPMPLEICDVTVSQSPVLEEEWQQVHPGVTQAAQDSAVALADHSYVSGHEWDASPPGSQPLGAPTPCHHPCQPSATPFIHPTSHHMHRDSEMLLNMLHVQTDIRDSLSNLATILENGLQQIVEAIRHVADRKPITPGRSQTSKAHQTSPPPAGERDSTPQPAPATTSGRVQVITEPNQFTQNTADDQKQQRLCSSAQQEVPEDHSRLGCSSQALEEREVLGVDIKGEEVVSDEEQFEIRLEEENEMDIKIKEEEVFPMAFSNPFSMHAAAAAAAAGHDNQTARNDPLTLRLLSATSQYNQLVDLPKKVILAVSDQQLHDEHQQPSGQQKVIPGPSSSTLSIQQQHSDERRMKEILQEISELAMKYTSLQAEYNYVYSKTQNKKI